MSNPAYVVLSRKTATCRPGAETIGFILHVIFDGLVVAAWRAGLNVNPRLSRKERCGQLVMSVRVWVKEVVADKLCPHHLYLCHHDREYP